MKGKTKLRLYKTGLVMMPEYNEPIRIPYTYISDIKIEDYSLTILTEFGEKIILQKMGNNFDSFKKGLSELMNDLSLKTQIVFKEMIPSLETLVLRQVAALLKDGKAVRKSDLDSVSKDAWDELEKKIKTSNSKGEYEFLRSLSKDERIYV